MNEIDLESALRAVHREIPSPTVSPALRARVLAIPTTQAKPSHFRWPSPSGGRPWLSSGIGLIAALAIVTVGTGAFLLGVGQSPTPAPTASPSPTSLGVTNGWIAYATSPGHTSPGSPAQYHDEWSDIYIVRAGGEPRLLVGGERTTRNVCPGFSADGEHLAYGEGSGRSSKKTLEREHRAIVVVALGPDGSIADPAIRLPVAGSGLVPCPIWSPDGQKLAYSEGDAIAIVGLDGASTVIPDWDPGPGTDPWEREFAWSPDGTAIAAARPSGTWVVSTDGGELRRLSSLPATWVNWSPDGAWIVTPGTVFSADGQHETLDLPRGMSRPLWSPSGDRYVYEGIEGGLVVAGPDGSDATPLRNADEGVVVAWSPDGRSLLLWRSQGGASWTLSLLSLDDEGGPVVLVEDIPTSSTRSHPGWGDITWQAVIR